MFDALALVLASLAVALLYHETLDHAWCYCILLGVYFHQVGEPPRSLLQWIKYRSSGMNTCRDAGKIVHNALVNVNVWIWCLAFDTMTLIFVCLASAFSSDGSTEIVRVVGVIGGLSLMAGNIIAYIFLRENFVMISPSELHIGNTQLTLTLTATDGYCASVTVGGAGEFLWKAALHAQIWLVSSSGGKAATAASGSMKANAHRWSDGKISAVVKRDQC
jgi:hypothetical protein